MIAALELYSLTLLDAWFLLGLPVLLLAVGVRLLTRRVSVPTASAALFRGAPRTLRQRLAWLPLAVKALAGACLVVALARPVERQVVPLEDEGIDIVLVVDTSSSMLQEDMRQQEGYRRIDAARDRALEFAEARVHDRVGLVAFARFAELRCPLTLDERSLAAFLRVLDTVPRGSEFDATAIGTALAKAVAVLGDSDARSKVVVMLSDGENNVDDILPSEAARLAADAGVRVHTIGLGKGVRSQLFGFQELSYDALKLIAETTGGSFFAARDDADLGNVYAQIDTLEKTVREDPRYRTVDRFEWPLGIGLSLLLLAVLGETLLFRRVP